MVPFSFLRIYVCIVLTGLVVYLMVIILHDVFSIKKIADTDDILLIAAASCIILDFVISIARFSFTDIFFFTRIGMAVFLSYSIVKLFYSLHQRQITKARSSMLKLASQTDMLTGCKSNFQLNDYLKGSDGIIVMFSLINIQEIRLEKGESESDNAIRTLAQFIRARFKAEEIYRIMFANFGVIVQTMSEAECKEAINLVLKDIDEYNDLKLGYELKVLYTYTTYKPHNLASFYRMYAELLNKLAQAAEQ